MAVCSFSAYDSTSLGLTITSANSIDTVGTEGVSTFGLRCQGHLRFSSFLIYPFVRGLLVTVMPAFNIIRTISIITDAINPVISKISIKCVIITYCLKGY